MTRARRLNRKIQFEAGLLLLALVGTTLLVSEAPAQMSKAAVPEIAELTAPGSVSSAPSNGSSSASTEGRSASAATVKDGAVAQPVSAAKDVPPLYAAHRYYEFKPWYPKLLNVDPPYFPLPDVTLPDVAESTNSPSGRVQSSSTDQSGTERATASDQAVNSARAQPLDESNSSSSSQNPNHVAEDATQPNSNFPPWALYSTGTFEPRIRPNAGIRLPRMIDPINSALLSPNYSPIVPDFDHTIANTRNWSVKVSLAEFAVYANPNSSKFNEFRDVHNGAVAGVEAHYRGTGGKYLNVLGRELGRKDEDLNIDGGVAGKYVLNFIDSWVPHNYMFGARSLYTGIGTGNLSIATGIRSDIQNSTSIADADTKLLTYDLQQGTPVNLSLQREKVGGDLAIAKTYPWLIKIGVNDESRDGERPWSASFGFSEFVEIPWAVHYDLWDYHVSAEWNKPQSRVYFLAGFRTSVFDDHVQSQTFSNPFRATDSANLVGTYDGGPAEGRIALYPTNESYEPSMMLVVKNLGWDSTLSWTLNSALGYNNTRLLPFSTNTSDTVYNTAGTAFNATDPAALPRQTAKASINSENTQVRWTAKPSENVHLNAEYRAFRNDVTTPRFVTADFVREDQDVRTPVNQCTEPCSANFTFSSLPIGYTRQTATLTGDYDFGHDNRLGVTYTFESWDRRYREVKYEDDNRVRITYDSKAKKWLDLKSWYEHTIRTTSKYNFNERHIDEGDADEATALPMLHKIDEAPYSKDDVQVIATFTLNDSMSVSTQGLFRKTNYNGQTFGLLNNSHQAYSVDYTYDANDRVSFFANYDYEKFHNRLYDRSFIPGDACDPYTLAPGYFSYCNWGGIPEDTYNTAGGGVDVYLTPKKLHTTIYYTLSKNHGVQKYLSVLGPNSTVDPNFFTPLNFNNVDSVTYHTINQELEYKISKTVDLAAGYQYEFWHDNDYNYNGFNYVNEYNAFNMVPTNTIPGTNLLMGGLLPPGYHANVAYFRLKIGL
ncbi:MAG TPA: MtrB/PioB family outer membrane beta-barrel protein [Candidatus Aquilonibacter sp.]|nr:MtrB/PioB family outer membrane beta-barrel protein [Candidatus Aquilonibacter sp.]